MLTFAQEFESLTTAVSLYEESKRVEKNKQLAAGHEHRHFLLNLLRDNGPLTARECIAATGWSDGNTRWHLRTLVERGEAIVINSGKVRKFGLPRARA